MTRATLSSLHIYSQTDRQTDRQTHGRFSNNSKIPGPTDTSDGLMTPEKNSVKLVIPCSSDKGRHQTTVDDVREKSEFRKRARSSRGSILRSGKDTGPKTVESSNS